MNHRKRTTDRALGLHSGTCYPTLLKVRPEQHQVSTETLPHASQVGTKVRTLSDLLKHTVRIYTLIQCRHTKRHSSHLQFCRAHRRHVKFLHRHAADCTRTSVYFLNMQRCSNSGRKSFFDSPCESRTKRTPPNSRAAQVKHPKFKYGCTRILLFRVLYIYVYICICICVYIYIYICKRILLFRVLSKKGPLFSETPA